MKRIVAIIIVGMFAPLKANAADPPLHVTTGYSSCSVKFASTLTQEAFRRFAREFGSVSAFRQGSPPTTLEPWQVSLGVDMISFPTDEHSAAWNDTFAHPDADHELGSRQNFPKFTLRVGVADNVDVGAYFTKNFQSNYGWLGFDGKYRILNESEGKPVSLAVRGAYTKTLFVSDMDMHALTVDASVERKIWKVVRPYVGAGSDFVFVRETSTAVDLSSEALAVPHLFGGFEVMLWQHLSLGAEVTLGALLSEQIQVGYVF